MEIGALQAVVPYAGLGGVAILVLWFVYRGILHKDFIPKLNRNQGYNILLCIVLFTFLSVIAGIGAFVIIARPPVEKATRLIYRGSVIAAIDKQPIRGAEVTILGNEAIGKRPSNMDGSFTLELPATAGKFEGTVIVRHPDYEPVTRPLQLRVDDTTGDPFELKWPEREWIGVVREESGVVAAGVAVTLQCSPPATTQTDSQGRFNFKARAHSTAAFDLRVERDGKILWNNPQAPSQNIQIGLSRSRE